VKKKKRTYLGPKRRETRRLGPFSSPPPTLTLFNPSLRHPNPVRRLVVAAAVAAVVVVGLLMVNVIVDDDVVLSSQYCTVCDISNIFIIYKIYVNLTTYISLVLTCYKWSLSVVV
jgi:hypothetical protein